SPLFPFGHGLSYSKFEFGAPRLEKSTIGVGESTSIRVTVTNRGKRQADETVQLDIRDLVSSVTRPVKELKGFERITLQPGESREAALKITPDQLSFWNIDMLHVVEPGEFSLMVGPNSEDLQAVTLTVK